MEKLTRLVSDPLSAWPVLQEKSRHVVDLVKAHPWTSLGVAAGTALVWSYVRAPRNLPPGPLGYPLIGAKSCFTMDLPKKMLDWRDTYGEVVSFYKYGTLNVILNSERTIKDAFAKQADDLSHRAESYIIDGIRLEDELFCAPVNDIWKRNKKFAVSTLKNYGFGTAKSEGKIHEQLQYLEEFILKTSATPIDVFSQLRLVSAGTIAKVFLGASGSWDDPDTKEIVRLIDSWYVSLNEAIMQVISYQKMLIPRQLAILLADFAPARATTAEIVQLLAKRITEAASDISDRTPETVVDAYVTERGSDPEVIQLMAKTILGFLPDAIDTTPVIMDWCLLYITLHQDVQDGLHKEVDSVVGTSRLPTLSDRVDMPYTQAVMAEVFRLTLPTPISLKRILHRDIKVDGYTLPKGAIVAGNFYAIHFDPEIFPDPTEFKPSRYIGSDGKFNTALAGRLLPFGIGSRKCVGEPYVKLYLFFFITRVVQRFNMSLDPAAPVPSTAGDSPFFVAKPEAFKVCFKAR